jgi:hypothetical protein
VAYYWKFKMMGRGVGRPSRIREATDTGAWWQAVTEAQEIMKSFVKSLTSPA